MSDSFVVLIITSARLLNLFLAHLTLLRMPLAVAVDMTDLSKTLAAPRRPELVFLSE
jgi:hypothetical protein